jgi:hypothetical protein
MYMVYATLCFGLRQHFGFVGLDSARPGGVLITREDWLRTPAEAKRSLDAAGRLRFGDPFQIRDIQILEDAEKLCAADDPDDFGYDPGDRANWRRRVYAMSWQKIRGLL